MERIIETAANGLGNTVGFLAETGILFAVFAILWIAFGVALVQSQGSLDAAWQWVRSLPFSSWAISSAERLRSDQSLSVSTALPELKLPPPKPGAETR